jgi:ATP-dependent DNA helicase RecQ
MERNELDLSKYEFDTISEQIKKVLLEPCFYEELIARIEGNQEKGVKVIRWLLENEKIVYRVDNRLEWRK